MDNDEPKPDPTEPEVSAEQLHDRLKELEKQYANFRIMGDGTINFNGSMKHGFTAWLSLPE